MDEQEVLVGNVIWTEENNIIVSDEAHATMAALQVKGKTAMIIVSVFAFHYETLLLIIILCVVC